MIRAVRRDVNSQKLTIKMEDDGDVMSDAANAAKQAAIIAAENDALAVEMETWQPVVDPDMQATALRWCDEAMAHPSPPPSLFALLDAEGREWLRSTREHINRMGMLHRRKFKILAMQAKKRNV